jgi:hypothetical protein
LWRRYTLAWNTAVEVWNARSPLTVDRKAFDEEVHEPATHIARDDQSRPARGPSRASGDDCPHVDLVVTMPTTFVCNDCALRFSSGWYHYHRFDSGYCGRTLLVCTECGTQHALEWALPNRGPPFVTPFRCSGKRQKNGPPGTAHWLNVRSRKHWCRR